VKRATRKLNIVGEKNNNNNYNDEVRDRKAPPSDGNLFEGLKRTTVDDDKRTGFWKGVRCSNVYGETKAVFLRRKLFYQHASRLTRRRDFDVKMSLVFFSDRDLVRG